MTDTIREYFQRYNDGITESVYSTMTISDYHRNKAYHEYLDFDRETIFRKNKDLCGIRNIDNSCYLSVTLQLLYNIQSFRERIFSITECESQFMIQLRKLFGMMYKGSLTYVDPTNIYLVLKQAYPTIFVDGHQNDFHEVFTIVLEHIEKTIPSEEDKRFFRKIFYGKNKINVFDKKTSEYIKSTENSYNIISLPSQAGSFDKAILDYKEETIEGYENSSGEKINAKRQTQFIETPGLLTFLINRVSFKDKKLVKDSSKFSFEDTIFFNKTNLHKNSKKINVEQIQKQAQTLKEWIKKIEKSKENLQSVLHYLEQKQFDYLNVPLIYNTVGEESRQMTQKYIKAEIQEIIKKVESTKIDIEKIQKKKLQIAEQNYSELYTLWALMIHSGKSASSGHYKMCIKIKDDTWIEFNDRRTQQISAQKIAQYSQKGEVCCIFYKRNNLICYSESSKVPASLKKLVQNEQQSVIKKIDNARILQSLYQEAQSANMIWQFQNILVRQNKYNYFFSPLKHLIEKNSSEILCKGLVLYEMISQEKFTENIRQKLIDPSSIQLQIPKINFGIPSEYWPLNQSLKQFLEEEYQNCNPIEAFKTISFCMDIEINNGITKNHFLQLRQLISLKGIFYESLLLEFNLYESYQILAVEVDKIFNAMPLDSNFVLICITLRDQLCEKYRKMMKQKPVAKGYLINNKKCKIINYSKVFEQRFALQIQMRQKLIQSHQNIFSEFKKKYKQYVKMAE